MKTMTSKLIDKILQESKAAPEELISLLTLSSPDALYAAATGVKERLYGRNIILRGIIEFSSHCGCDCQYCGLYCGNKKLPRYRLTEDEIVNYAREAYAAGYRSIVLQSGEDFFYDADRISSIIRQIKGLGDMILTLSIGERSHEDYAQWYRDGADRYLLKHETADEALYNSLHPHSSFKKRLACLWDLKSIGYQTGSGFMVGLPGQTLASLARDILLLQELSVDMAGIGIYIPHPDTPLAGATAGSPDLAIACVALSRILMKKVHLPSTTSIEAESTERYTSLSAGANVIMKKIEAYKYRKMYEIYPNPKIFDKSILEERMELEEFVLSRGLNIERTVQ
jgi:biotin synthase